MANFCNKSAGQRILARFIYFALRTNGFLLKALNNFGELISGFSLSLMNNEGIAHLNAAVYNTKKSQDDDFLFDWEAEWFEHDLPPPPARLLVGGAGAGREVKALVRKAYYVVGFDPAEQCVEKARREIKAKNCPAFFTGAYEDLLADGGCSSGLSSVVSARAPYDAIILGWGSLTHLRGHDTRIAILQKLRQFCPEGPVLMSFWLKEHPDDAAKGRAFKLGYRIGGLLTHRNKTAGLPPEGDGVTPHAGYGHFFTMQEIEKLVEKSGFERVENPKVSYFKAFPHITIRSL